MRKNVGVTTNYHCGDTAVTWVVRYIDGGHGHPFYSVDLETVEDVPERIFSILVDKLEQVRALVPPATYYAYMDDALARRTPS